MATSRLAGNEAPAVADGEERLSRLLAWAALAGIVVLALWLRWDRLEYTEYTRDQAWVLNRAWEWLHGGEFPLVGIQSSVGTSQGAIEIWLLAIPVAISADPRLAAAFVGLLQVLAIVGTYLLCTPYFGRGVGLVAALLFAVNPWALQYARKVWTPNLAPLFTILFFSALYAAVVQRRRYWLALSCLWAAVLFLIHPSAVYCFALLAVAAVLFWRRLGWPPFVLGGALAFLVALPFIWYEYLHQFKSIKIYLSLTGNQSRFDFDAVKNVLTMASAQAFPTMMGYGFTGEWSLPDQTLQNQLAVWLLYLGLFWSLLLLVRPLFTRLAGGRWGAGGWERALLLLLWFALPILVALRHPLDYYPHYFINVLPVQYVLMALGLVMTVQTAVRVFSRRARWVGAGAGPRRRALPGRLAGALLPDATSATCRRRSPWAATASLTATPSRRWTPLGRWRASEAWTTSTPTPPASGTSCATWRARTWRCARSTGARAWRCPSTPAGPRCSC